MAKGEFIASALLRLEIGGARAPWQLELQDLLAVAGRPLTRVVRVQSEGKVRVYEGWRAAAIGEVLDACSVVDGDWWIAKSTRFDSRGRSYEGHTRPNGAHLAWRQNNPEAARENSRKQAAKWRERARSDWYDYCAAYADKFPGQQPVGFDRWCRGGRSVWLERGPQGIEFNDTSRSFQAEILGSVEEAQGRTRRRRGVSGS